MLSSRDSGVACGFLLAAIGILIYLWTILSIYPLTDWAFTSLEWCQAWLAYSTLDYYGAAACLCAICLYSEESVILGILWSLSFCLLGAPACMAYVCYRLFVHGNGLALEGRKAGIGGNAFRYIGGNV